VASYRDLLDAIARVGSATGRPDAWTDGLDGADVAVACSPLSPPAAVTAVLAKLTAAHPAVFAAPPASNPPAAGNPPKATDPPPAKAEGATAEAIRGAESALARQRSDAAHLDLQVLTAVANAHATAADGLARLAELQHEIETAVASRTDLDTPAGARELQRFLIGKMRDIRDVVQNAALDAASRATLADALAALYGASTPEVDDRVLKDRIDKPAPPASGGADPVAPERLPPDPDLGDALPDYLSDPPSVYDPSQFITAPTPPTASPPLAGAMPAMPFGGGVPGSPFGNMAPFPTAAPFGGGGPVGGSTPLGGLPSMAGSLWPDLSPAGSAVDLPSHDALPGDDPQRSADSTDGPEESDEGGVDAHTDAPAADPTPVLLPDGQTVLAPTPELASVISAAVAGAPIPTAFSWQGITIPAPGSPVTAPVDPARLVPGDIAVLADRHALALGNGRVLLDKQIQPISSVNGPGFIGWQHPPDPDPINVPPVPPAPDRSPATAPS